MNFLVPFGFRNSYSRVTQSMTNFGNRALVALSVLTDGEAYAVAGVAEAPGGEALVAHHELAPHPVELRMGRMGNVVKHDRAADGQARQHVAHVLGRAEFGVIAVDGDDVEAGGGIGGKEARQGHVAVAV